MEVELINTGSELLLGRILNSHQQWLCNQLTQMGYCVTRQVAVPDNGPEISEAIAEAIRRARLVLCTGGLGPTSDDRTRDMVAQLLGRRLLPDETVRRQIRSFFEQRGRVLPPSTEVQALVPEGARVLLNQCGTAPGLVLEIPANGLLILLPGPPNELRPMFLNQVAPLIRTELPAAHPIQCRTLRSTGLGESLVEEKIAGPLEALVQGGLELGYCARPGEVDVRLVTRGPGGAELLGEGEKIVRDLLGEIIFGVDEEELEEVVIRLLNEKHRTLAVAESCTGGALANRLTNVPGASVVFHGGVISYSNQAKVELLGVEPEVLLEHGAVSEQAVMQMAQGARVRLNADYAVAITGIAGPGGGTKEKPVGTVFLAIADAHGVKVHRRKNASDRQTFKHMTTQQALDLIRRALLESQPERQGFS